jgi:hypothetical protein
LGNYYSKYAGTKLKDLLEEVSKQSDKERMSLAEEIDVARINTSRALQIFEKVGLNNDFRDTSGKQVELTQDQILKFKTMSAEAVSSGLNQVSALVQAMAKVEALKADKISVNNIKWVVDRVLRLIEDVVGAKYPDTAKELCDKISEMRLLDDGATNTKVVLSI